MSRTLLPSLLGIASVASFGLSLWFSYQAGCAGDLKSGNYGDMQLALHYEGVSGYSLVGGTLLGVVAAILAGRSAPRIARIAAVGIIPAAIVLWLIGWRMEDWGIESCFPR
jgi:hypothetical protein